MSKVVREIMVSVGGKPFAAVKVMSLSDPSDDLVKVERRLKVGDAYEAIGRVEVGKDTGTPLDGTSDPRIVRGIVSGGEFREIDPETLSDALMGAAVPTLQIEGSMRRERVPWSRAMKTYFLVPAGADATIAAIHRALRKTRSAFVVRFHVRGAGPQRLGVMYDEDGALCLTVLRWASEIADVHETADALRQVATTDRHVAVAEGLIKAVAVDEPEAFIDAQEDSQRAAIKALVKSVVEGEYEAPDVEPLEMDDDLDALASMVEGALSA